MKKARIVPQGTFEQDRKLRPAEGVDRPHPGKAPEAIEYRFAETYFPPVRSTK